MKYTKFQVDLLAAVALTDEQHGLGVLKHAEAIRNEEINHGRLYPNLQTLVERGLIDKEKIDGRTKCYTLTDEGSVWLEARAEALVRAHDEDARDRDTAVSMDAEAADD